MIEARDHPAGRALEDGQPSHLLVDLWNELRRGRAGTDDAHTLTAQVMVVIPAGGVNASPLEVGEPPNVGVLRLDQPASRGDERLGPQRPTAGV